MKHAWMVCVLAIAFSAPISFPAAAAVTVSGDDADSITLNIEDATVAAVLEHLRDKFDFSIDGAEHAKSGEVLSTTMTGSLSDVLARLLRNWNYVVVSSPETAGGIEKVIILNAVHGTTPSSAPSQEGEKSNSDQTGQVTGD